MSYFLDDIEVEIVDDFEEDYQEYCEVVPIDYDGVSRIVLKSRLKKGVYEND